ncbi:hypothetical protein VTJ83DRAFT_325 [Remersonia thermophila]|uniref:Uncharacterized protein n=1 Tax=Remersonia thermophila TaxID=72144 RepID=A0ABR4DKR6_9PEZI
MARCSEPRPFHKVCRRCSHPTPAHDETLNERADISEAFPPLP